MDLNQLSIVARQRSAWEAIDLGVLLARAWYLPLFIGWLVPSFMCFVILTILFWGNTWLPIIVTWWLKPVWDRIPLYLASRALFGEPLDLSQALKQIPRLLFRDLFAWLTWRRLSLTRSFDMPVTLLEDLRGQKRRQRLNVLQFRSGGAATFLTVVCVHIELIFVLGAIGLVMWLIPEEVDFDVLKFFQAGSFGAELLGNTLSYAAMAIVAPFYCVAGFMLYIGRRMELEGWDIEIRFRHIAQIHAERAQRTKNIGQIVASVMLAPILLLAFPGGQAAAKDSAENPVNAPISANSPREAAQHDIQNILQGDDFGQETTIRSWRFKDSKEIAEDDEIPDWLIRFIEFLEEYSNDDSAEETHDDGWFSMFAARGLEVTLWLVAITLLVFLLYFYRDQLRQVSVKLGMAKKPDAAPELMFGLDVRKESLPDNVPEQVLALWRQEKYREALGLLYRATLSRLIHDYEFKFNASKTESECAEIVRLAGTADLSSYITTLTRHWQRLAYGHRIPAEPDIINLCHTWPELFSHEN